MQDQAAECRGRVIGRGDHQMTALGKGARWVTRALATERASQHARLHRHHRATPRLYPFLARLGFPPALGAPGRLTGAAAGGHPYLPLASAFIETPTARHYL